MDSARFDRIVTSFAETRTRRQVFRFLGVAALGAAGFASFAGNEADARKKCPKGKKGKKCRKHQGTSTLPDRCPVSAPAPNSPTCGMSAEGEACTCTRATEGNNICVNFIDQSCDTLRSCTNTKECRDTVGFHFFCQAAGTGSCGQRCVPECDNTSPF